MNVHAETSFCEHYCVQMGNLIPDTFGKCSPEGLQPFLTKIILIMNSCVIQYNAPLVKHVNVAQLINCFCQEQLVF